MLHVLFMYKNNMFGSVLFFLFQDQGFLLDSIIIQNCNITTATFGCFTWKKLKFDENWSNGIQSENIVRLNLKTTKNWVVEVISMYKVSIKTKKKSIYIVLKHWPFWDALIEDRLVNINFLIILNKNDETDICVLDWPYNYKPNVMNLYAQTDKLLRFSI